MAVTLKLFQWLSAATGPALDTALAAALPTARPPHDRLIAQLILQRAHPRALAVLVAHLHHFAPPQRHDFAARIPLLPAVLRLATQMPGLRPALNVLDLVRHRGAADFAYLAATLLRRRHTVVQAVAAHCLLSLGQRLQDPAAQSLAATACLDDALADAVHSYPVHRRSETLLALLSGISRFPRASKALLSSEHALLALQKLLARSSHPLARRCLLTCLTLPPLRHAAALGLRHAFIDRAWADLGAQAALLPTVSLADLATPLASLAKYLPNGPALADLPQHLQQALVLWTQHMPWPAQDQAAFLRQYASVAVPTPVRSAALHALAALPRHDSVCIALWPFTADPEPELSSFALRTLLARNGSCSPTHLPPLLSSPHPETRMLAEQALAALAWQRLWDAWPHLTGPQRLQVARSAAKAGIPLLPTIRRVLAKPNCPVHCLRAIALARELQLAPSLEPILRRLALRSDAVVASAAVMALGECPGLEARVVLERCLDHADARVRSNAIEALQRLDPLSRRSRLRQMARDEANRPRATAIHALLTHDPPAAHGALSRMLHDPRPRHRASALWVVESRAVLPFAACVAEMAVSDSDIKVRARAARVACGLVQAMSLPAPLSPPAQAA